jgi:hypothetical protein
MAGGHITQTKTSWNGFHQRPPRFPGRFATVTSCSVDSRLSRSELPNIGNAGAVDLLDAAAAAWSATRIAEELPVVFPIHNGSMADRWQFVPTSSLTVRHPWVRGNRHRRSRQVRGTPPIRRETQSPYCPSRYSPNVLLFEGCELRNPWKLWAVVTGAGRDREGESPVPSSVSADGQLLGAMGDTGHSANRADGAEFTGWALDIGA